MHRISCTRLLRLLAIIVPAIVLTGCFGDGSGKSKVAAAEPAPYLLVFEDNFDVDGAPSAATWTIETGYGPNNDGNGNNEWQLYTDSPDNVRVEGGNLVISALCPTPPCGVRDGTITSGKINSLDKFEFKFGRIEARIKPPVGDGAWPAFWALGANHPQVGWPRSGEIDFMEMHNFISDERTTHFTLHWCDQTVQGQGECPASPGWIFDSQFLTTGSSLGDDFHIFEAEWDAEKIVGKIDGIEYFRKRFDPDTMEEFLRKFYLIFNVAMGGTLGSGNQDPNGNETYPQTMLVDYVRVYQREGEGEVGVDVDDGGPLIDFEDNGGPYMFNDFEGGVGFVTENPDMDGNTSAKVARLLKFAGGQNFAGTTLTAPDVFDVPLGSSFTMNVWSRREGPVRLLFKLEGGLAAELEGVHPGIDPEDPDDPDGGWRVLTFDFPGISGTFTGFTFILDNGEPGNPDGNNPDDPNWNFYIDDIVLIPGDGVGVDPGGPIDFEPAGGPYTFNDFEGGVGFVIENPDTNGNTSANVAQMLKFAGGAGELFAGTTLKLNSPLDAADGTSFTMKVWSMRPSLPGPVVTFKLEGSSDAETTEVVPHGNTGWEELTFELPDATGTFNGITFIFDNGTAGATPTDPPSIDPNWNFYIDDITQIPPDNCNPGNTIDFEGGDCAFNDFDGGNGSVVDNPDMDGNTSTRVGRMVKGVGATFAGTTLKLGGPLEITEDSSFTMKVWSDRPVNVLFKLEEADPFIQTEVAHGGTGWEELTFEFPGVTGTFIGITLIFDNGTAVLPADDPSFWTFYFDDISLIPLGGGSPNSLMVDFEGPVDDYNFDANQESFGSFTTVIDNPFATGINLSARAAQQDRFGNTAGAPGGSQLILASPLEVAAGSSFTIKVWSPRALDSCGAAPYFGCVVLKLGSTGAELVGVAHGGAGWQELTFDFPMFAGDVSEITISEIILYFDFVKYPAGMDTSDMWTFYFDDIVYVPAGTRSTETVLVNFERPVESYDFGLRGVVGGGPTAVVPNRVSGSVNPSANVARVLKFAGKEYSRSRLALASPVQVPAGSIFTTKVWSPRVVDVLLELNGAVNDQVRAAHRGTGWEEMRFAFPHFAGSVENIGLEFDLGINGAAATDPGNWTFYFDDITLITFGR